MSKAREQLKNHRHAYTVLNLDGTWCRETQRVSIDGCEAYDLAKHFLDAIEKALEVTRGTDGLPKSKVEVILERALEGNDE